MASHVTVDGGPAIWNGSSVFVWAARATSQYRCWCRPYPIGRGACAAAELGTAPSPTAAGMGTTGLTDLAVKARATRIVAPIREIQKEHTQPALAEHLEERGFGVRAKQSPHDQRTCWA